MGASYLKQILKTKYPAQRKDFVITLDFIWEVPGCYGDKVAV